MTSKPSNGFENNLPPGCYRGKDGVVRAKLLRVRMAYWYGISYKWRGYEIRREKHPPMRDGVEGKWAARLVGAPVIIHAPTLDALRILLASDGFRLAWGAPGRSNCSEGK